MTVSGISSNQSVSTFTPSVQLQVKAPQKVAVKTDSVNISSQAQQLAYGGGKQSKGVSASGSEKASVGFSAKG
jgi:hypothetical protein